MKSNILKNSLEKEHTINKIFELLESKDKIKFNSEIKDLSGLYFNSIYVNQEKFNNQVDCIVYDEEGFELLNIEPPFINQCSLEDYLNDNRLFLDLINRIEKIEKSNILVLCNE